MASFLLRAYRTDEVVTEARSDVANFSQSTAVTEETYSRIPFDKAVR